MSVNLFALVEKYRERYDYNSTTDQAFRKLLEEMRTAEKSDYLGTLYRTDFQVTGRGAFPIDMLRYASCRPKDETDARAIEESIESADATDPFTITLTKEHRDARPQLAEDRWEQRFHWRVLPSSIETVRL